MGPLRPPATLPSAPVPSLPCPRVQRQKPLSCVDGKAWVPPRPSFLKPLDGTGADDQPVPGGSRLERLLSRPPGPPAPLPGHCAKSSASPGPGQGDPANRLNSPLKAVTFRQQRPQGEGNSFSNNKRVTASQGYGGGLYFYLFSLKSFPTAPWLRAKCLCSSVKASQVLAKPIRLDTVRQLEVLKGLGCGGQHWRRRSWVARRDRAPWMGGGGRQQSCFPGEAPMPLAPQAHSPRGQHGAEQGGFPASLSRGSW